MSKETCSCRSPTSHLPIIYCLSDSLLVAALRAVFTVNRTASCSRCFAPHLLMSTFSSFFLCHPNLLPASTRTSYDGPHHSKPCFRRDIFPLRYLGFIRFCRVLLQPILTLYPCSRLTPRLFPTCCITKVVQESCRTYSLDEPRNRIRDHAYSTLTDVW